MTVRRVLPILVLLTGFSLSVQAQGTLPVEVICVKGGGTYKPICGDTKKAVNTSSRFRQGKNGSRYVIIVFAQKGKIDDGRISAAFAIGASISDPLSQVFPYSFGGIPWVFAPSESRILGQAIVDGALPVFVDVFSTMTNEINSFGFPAEGFDPTIQERVLEAMHLEMDKTLREQDE